MKTNSSLLGGFGLALIGTSCCALPILLVTLGMGSAVASLVSASPWLVALSNYKAITFTATAIILGYCFYRLYTVNNCELADRQLLKLQRAILWTSTAFLVVSILTAYALLPLVLWWENVL